MDDLLKNKANYELIESLLKEVAKASSEIRCAESDIKKASSRIGFSLVLINILLDRESEDDQTNQKEI